YDQYLSHIQGSDVYALLRVQLNEVEQLSGILDEGRASYRYAEGKWSIKELIGHLIDCERIFGYRALCIARGEQQPLPGFDEDTYVAQARFDNREFVSIVEEFLALRLANIIMFDSLSADALANTGNANGHPVTVRAIICIVAAHTQHHLTVLRERYQL
ncbi:MAG: DinB family protein, partial [Ignavibacteria bacterium]